MERQVTQTLDYALEASIKMSFDAWGVFGEYLKSKAVNLRESS